MRRRKSRKNQGKGKNSRMKMDRFREYIATCPLRWAGFFVLSLMLVSGLPSCDGAKQQGGTGGKILPNITGGAGEVLVVMDDFNWDNSAGKLLKDVLMEEFPGLPQSEPLFDVIHVTAGSFDNMYQYHRSIVLTTVSPDLEKGIRFRENVWAKPQIVVQITAPTGTGLREVIQENEERIQNYLVVYDRNRLMDAYRDSKDLGIQKEIADHHQIRLAIPRGYNLDFSDEDYTSVSIETPDLSQVIQVYDYPASGTEDLSTQKLIEKRNEFTMKYVKGPREDSYMIVSKLYKPIVYDLKINNMDVVEIRGLWELENGFMGGPFISHSVFDAKRNRIVTVDGYIYYPNQKKRTKIRQLEAIIYSMEII
jgi:hypothetical protein